MKYKIDWIGQCAPTDYARQQGASIKDGSNSCDWWTRTRAKYDSGMAVAQQNELHIFAEIKNEKKLGIRPAILIDTSLLE